MDSGWIKLYRKIRDNPFWPKSRRYTPLEALLDILMSANYTPAKTLHGTSTLIPVERGQFITSQVKLAERWMWNRKTVKKFLLTLKKDEMLDIETRTGADIGFTLITIRNYSKYQDREDDTLDIEMGSKGTSDGLSNGLLLANSKKVKKGKNKNMRTSSPPSTNGDGVAGAPPSSNGDGAAMATLEESFKVFYQAYPKKKSKGYALKAWLNIRPGGELLKTMLVAISRAKESHDWQKEGGQFIPYPANWLNSQGWEDETETEEVENPYARWPVIVDCQTCGDAHEQDEQCRQKMS